MLLSLSDIVGKEANESRSLFALSRGIWGKPLEFLKRLCACSLIPRFWCKYSQALRSCLKPQIVTNDVGAAFSYRDVPQLMMGSHPGESIINRKYCKPNMHLPCLVYSVNSNMVHCTISISPSDSIADRMLNLHSVTRVSFFGT